MTTVVRCTIEMDLYEGDHFNSIGMDEDPPVYATEEQARAWAKNAFIEIVQDILTYGGDDIEDYVQTKIVDEPT